MINGQLNQVLNCSIDFGGGMPSSTQTSWDSGRDTKIWKPLQRYLNHVTRLSQYVLLPAAADSIRQEVLTIDSTHAIVWALILSRLDYYNGLLSNIPNTLPLLCQLDGVFVRCRPGNFSVQKRFFYKRWIT